MSPALMPAHEVPFAPIQPSGQVQVARLGDHTGIILWQFANGDALFRTVSQTWYVPSGAWQPHTTFTL